ncbi:MAG: outer membrane protein assembly factor BamD [Cytophagales bacterium]|nr:MAG: outer membrane protein assembly factor BamD [Cytophagales bacterium]
MQRKKNIFQYIFILGLLLQLTACSEFIRIQRYTDPLKKYEAAINYYNDKSYAKALLLFEEIIPLLAGSKESETAQFYHAYCYFYQEDYELSAYYFDKFFNTFRRSNFAEEAYFMYVNSLYKKALSFHLDQSETQRAIASSQTMINMYKETAYKEECERIIEDLTNRLEKKAFYHARLYARIGYNKSAVITFENFQKDFPDSDYSEEVAYQKIVQQYKYAKNSTERRMEDRFNTMITFYEYLVDNYPDSRYIKMVENYYDDALVQIQKLKQKKNGTVKL